MKVCQQVKTTENCTGFKEILEDFRVHSLPVGLLTLDFGLFFEGKQWTNSE